MTEAVPIDVEVAYALPNDQLVLKLSLPRGATVRQAIEQSGIRARFPGFDFEQTAVGIFGKAVPSTKVLQDGDRVEIYRRLIVDPKQQRRQRARKIRAGG